MTHIIIIFLVLYISLTSFYSSASDPQENKEDFHLIEINSENDSNSLGSDPLTNGTTNKKSSRLKRKNKLSYIRNKDNIERNIAEFNSIIYYGKDLLRTSPFNQDAATIYRIIYYSTITIFSLGMGVAAAIPIVGATELIEFKEESLMKLQQELLKNINLYDSNHIQQITNTIIAPAFNDSNNYNIKKEFIYLFISVSTLFSVLTYKTLHYASNVLSLKKYRDFINSRSLLSSLSKLGIIITISGLYFSGIQENINKTLQIMNNTAKGYLLDHEDPTIKIIGNIFCGAITFLISSIACLPIVNLLVNTIAEGINTLARKELSFNDSDLPKCVHKLLDTATQTNLSKKFIWTLLSNNFNQQDSLQLKKTLQIMDLNPSETINLAGVLNNFTITSLKNTKYSLEDKNYNKQFISGLIKLAIISGATVVLVKIGNNLYNDMIVAELLMSSDALIYSEGLNNIDAIVNHLGGSVDKSVLDNYMITTLRRKILEAIKKNSNSLGLATQLAVYSASGVLHMLLGTSEAIYVITKHRGKYYRGPIVLVSSILSIIVPILISISMCEYFDSEVDHLEQTEKVQQLVGIDTSVLGINSLTTKLNIVKAGITFGILQTYKHFIPFTTSAILNIKKVFNYCKGHAIYHCEDK
jgi:hypothetical protein